DSAVRAALASAAVALATTIGAATRSFWQGVAGGLPEVTLTEALVTLDQAFETDLTNIIEGNPSGDDTFGPPAQSASKLQWVTYAQGLGITTDGLTKQEIIDAVNA